VTVNWTELNDFLDVFYPDAETSQSGPRELKIRVVEYPEIGGRWVDMDVMRLWQFRAHHLSTDISFTAVEFEHGGLEGDYSHVWFDLENLNKFFRLNSEQWLFDVQHNIACIDCKTFAESDPDGHTLRVWIIYDKENASQSRVLCNCEDCNDNGDRDLSRYANYEVGHWSEFYERMEHYCERAGLMDLATRREFELKVWVDGQIVVTSAEYDSDDEQYM
jgi:hypothetical protein